MIEKYIVIAQKMGSDNSGATAIEYGLIAAGIAVAIAAGVALLGENIAALFESVANAVSPAG
jgi:pilus assembly protein Flp/PilA